MSPSSRFQLATRLVVLLALAGCDSSSAPSNTAPVAVVGGLRRPETLEKMLLENAADLFSLSRPLLWEPDLPRRWESGDRKPARCISCNGCFAPGREGRGVRCVVREREAEGTGSRGEG